MSDILESKYQKKVIRRLEDEFPGCVILKNDPKYKKNIPDLSVFYKDHYAFLEVKRSQRAALESKNEDERANQVYWVDRLNNMSMASFIFPENEDEVFARLHESWKED